MSNKRYDHHYNHPSSSFSSSLLEKIYRSIDQGDDHDAMSYRKSSKMMNKVNTSCCMETRNMYDYKRQNMLDELAFNTINHNPTHKINNPRRNSIVEVNKHDNFSSSSSSSLSTSCSDSSSGIGGPTSESESSFSYMSSISNNLKLKPIRTSSFNPSETHRKSYSDETPAKKKSNHGNSTSNNKEGSLQKRALKLYNELKKVKQPISPGGKLTSFLNSLFNSTSKKTKTSSPGRERVSTPGPSTASSYTRSCLSKTPSTGRFERRTVRFCPNNTVINNECNLVKKESVDDNEELKVKIMEKNRRVEEVAKELLKNYHHGRKYNQNEVINVINKSINTNDASKINRFEDEYEDNDNVSCCSSELFELDNLVDVGVDRRYRQELPVYETTRVDTNRAIANGFIL